MSLRRALDLAERGRGTTHPNPVVGAVVVRDGEVVGEGWHERKGGPHAEAAALEAAGERAKGATLYVTMEPCTHQGSTPPCTEAVLNAGVAKVVAGALDPNPKAGGGLDLLGAAGVEVELIDSFEARAQNEAWRTWVSEQRPFVTYKAAMTLDGRLTIPGSRWVTGEDSRHLVHQLRAASDAVAVGMGTVRADDPRLDARDVEVIRQPRRLAFGAGPLPRRLGARAADRWPSRRARSARGRRRPVAPAGGRPDDRSVVPARGSRRQADRVRRAEALGGGADAVRRRGVAATSWPVGESIGR